MSFHSNNRGAYRQRPNHGPRNSNRPTSRAPKKENIHPSKFVQAARPLEQAVYQPTHTFSDFSISEKLKSRIANRGFTHPSPIQDQIIPHGLKGEDVLGIADTGTGKTMAFAIPVLEKLLSDRNAKALVIAPTRELAEQILDEFKTLMGKNEIFWALLIGGSNMGRQLSDLRRNPRLIIGTPGRIKDHKERGTVNIDAINMVVLDEVDRMLDMGFVHEMRRILISPNASKRQHFFFSATIDERVRTLIGEFSPSPITVSIKTGPTTDSVEQGIVHYADSDEKFKKLQAEVSIEDAKILIFDDTRRLVEKLSKSLVAEGFKVNAIHGGKNQSQRRRALDAFKNNHINILVATDVAARGIDVDGITHVINYSTPQTYSDYTHRIGRAGRAGKTGNALTFIERR